jgi:tRNA threonylcarbamoyladenosine biosynthesis protein TsaE
MELVYDLKEIAETASRFWQENKDRRVFAFSGEMGAGKTTFIHALCDARGVKDAVGSPTFSLINEYQIPGPVNTPASAAEYIYHIDLYRIKDEQEAIRSGIEDVLSGRHICLLEWPERAPGILPPETVMVDISVAGNGLRRIIIHDN